MNGEPRYAFYEKVVVSAPGKEIHGELGAILGMAQNDDGTWGYAVHIYRDEECWDLHERELIPTGQFDCRESFYDGSLLEVEVDPDGSGRIVRFIDGEVQPDE